MKTLSFKISEEEHKSFKNFAIREGKTFKDFFLFLLKNYQQPQGEDKDWNNFMKSWESAEIEEPDELDIEISKRAKKEIAKGEVEDYEDVMRELDLEDESKVH